MRALSDDLKQIGSEDTAGCAFCGVLVKTTSACGKFVWFRPSSECCAKRLEELKRGRGVELRSIANKMNAYDLPEEIPLDLIALQDSIRGEVHDINKLIAHIQKTPDYEVPNVVKRPPPIELEGEVAKVSKQTEAEANAVRNDLARQASQLLPMDEYTAMTDEEANKALESLFYQEEREV